jgi:hypothetical protein
MKTTEYETNTVRRTGKEYTALSDWNMNYIIFKQMQGRSFYGHYNSFKVN